MRTQRQAHILAHLVGPGGKLSEWQTMKHLNQPFKTVNVLEFSWIFMEESPPEHFDNLAKDHSSAKCFLVFKLLDIFAPWHHKSENGVEMGQQLSTHHINVCFWFYQQLLEIETSKFTGSKSCEGIHITTGNDVISYFQSAIYVLNCW